MARQKIVGIRIPELAQELAQDKESGLFLEQLRYAGAMGTFQFPNVVEIIFVPRHIDSSMAETWAKANIDRMASFGIYAEIVKG